MKKATELFTINIPEDIIRRFREAVIAIQNSTKGLKKQTRLQRMINNIKL